MIVQYLKFICLTFRDHGATNYLNSLTPQEIPGETKTNNFSSSLLCSSSYSFDIVPFFSAEAVNHELVPHRNRTRRQVQNLWNLLLSMVNLLIPSTKIDMT